MDDLSPGLVVLGFAFALSSLSKAAQLLRMKLARIGDDGNWVVRFNG
jgi:hypothetical protein